MFKFKEYKEISGIIERIGFNARPSEITATSFIIKDSNIVFNIYRDNQADIYPIGLTQVGDSVVFVHDDNGSVDHSDFINVTLEERLGHLKNIKRK